MSATAAGLETFEGSGNAASPSGVQIIGWHALRAAVHKSASRYYAEMACSKPRYSVAVRRTLIAQHILVGGDFGRENERNSHQFVIEARYEGSRLNDHGFLVDIAAIGGALDALVDRYRDRTLNDLPEFEGLNPSAEHFAQVLSDRLAIAEPNVDELLVTVWEDDDAWAAYRRPLPISA